ncbi:unnamed protein product [Polarella glacialis]|uniref:Uncharacterized protein n=1 Tax=Polarella glacialis TaxID=89957 RepID=A0A813LKG4_POLGL|nr:unnamed protein product [Polarella glacialis]
MLQPTLEAWLLPSVGAGCLGLQDMHAQDRHTRPSNSYGLQQQKSNLSKHLQHMSPHVAHARLQCTCLRSIVRACKTEQANVRRPC